MKRSKFVKATTFVLIFLILLSGVSRVVTNSDKRSYHFIRGFYENRKDSLDAVMIGGSNIFCSWCPPLAWARDGIAVYSFVSPAMRMSAAEYMIREARKTQPDALYIVAVNTIYLPFNLGGLHYLTDFMPPSLIKYQLMNKLVSLGDFTPAEKAGIYIPLIQYHSRWSELRYNDFHYELDGLKGGYNNLHFLTDTADVTKYNERTSERTEMTDYPMESLESLLAYCDQENVNVLFLTIPQLATLELQSQFNTFNDIVSSHGYPILNLLDHFDEIGLDPTKDYMNRGHNNLRGAIKMTDYISRYLKEHYDFQDKRGEKLYSDWDEAWEKYEELISPYYLDFEWNNELVDLSMKAPSINKIAVSGTTLKVTWEKISNADGYRIFRKTDDTGWSAVSTVGADTLAYIDAGLEPGVLYTYTIVPFRDMADGREYGEYSPGGRRATAQMDAPEIELSGGENNLTISWTEPERAEVYFVYRRIPGEQWEELASEIDGTSYTDTNMRPDTPYQYRVRALWNKSEDSRVWSAYSVAKSYLPESSGAQVTATVTNGTPVLTWPAITWTSGFTIERKDAYDDNPDAWESVTEPLPGDTDYFIDHTAVSGMTYCYRVTAVLTVGKNTYQYPTETEALFVSAVNNSDIAA